MSQPSASGREMATDPGGGGGGQPSGSVINSDPRTLVVVCDLSLPGLITTPPTMAYQVFLKNNRHTPVMVYNDLMIRNNTVYYYNTNRSRPVTVRCINTGVGAPVDRRRLTGMICPNRTLISVRIIVPFFHMASSPLSISHQLILAIDIV